MSKTALYLKTIGAGLILCVGGPALIYYVTPTEEEIRKRYNPDLRRRSEETRLERQERFDAFASKMKEYARSDRPIWEVPDLSEVQPRQRSQGAAPNNGRNPETEK